MSDKNTSFLLALVNSAIHEDIIFNENGSGIDWEEIYDMAKRNLILSLLYDQVRKLSETYLIPEELLLRWKEVSLRSMLMECEKYTVLRRIVTLAREQSITLIIFKGCILANLYPKYSARISCDSDILVYQHDSERAIQLLESLGFHKNEPASKELVYVYLHETINYQIELHFSLWEDYKSSKIDLLEKMNLTEEQSLIKLNACGMEVTTLGYEEHLVFQMFHIIKHFSLQGVNVRYLIDITLYMERYQEFIDYKKFWEKMELIGYEQFCESFFAICVQYLDMSSKILEKRHIDASCDTEKLLMDLINVGTAFHEMNSNWELLSIFTPFFTGEQEVSTLKIWRRIHIIFPPSHYLQGEYAYAKKYRILLPIAWIHRFYRYIYKWFRHNKEWSNAKEKLSVIEHRLSLMRSLGLADGGKK